MPLVALATVKLHLRKDTSDEDTLITLYSTVGEQQAAEFLNRNVYEDSTALNAAIAAAPAALAAATVIYDAAIVAAELLAEEVERDAATKYAQEIYARALKASDYAQRGIVVNASIQAALLLAVGNLFEHRGTDATELPAASMSLLMPYRVGLGV